MPGPISQHYPGPGADSPYVPSWCYEGGKPPMCSCGHHHGYHNDAGKCLQARWCRCAGYDGADPDATTENGTHEHIEVHRDHFRKVQGIRAAWRSFRSGYRFYMGYWFDIWVREGIKPWMLGCKIWAGQPPCATQDEAPV